MLRYLSRYTHRVAISNRRLVAADDAGVAFRWKDYRIAGPDRWKTMRLAPARVHPALSPARAAQGLPPHPPLRALRQRQPRRKHRKSPCAARRRPACRRPETAAGDHTGRAACGALPMPALRRPHDRHRGLRARLRAEVAADAKQVRHVMSRTSSARRLPVPLRWLRAGGDPSRPNSRQSMRPAPVDTLQTPPGSPLPRLSASRRVQLSGSLAPVRARHHNAAPT